MSAALAEATVPNLADQAGRYLTFVLRGESYGIPVRQVREIMRQIDITPAPRMPGCVKGVINLRGKMLPVVDLRLRFELPNAEFTERTCTIVVQVNYANGVQSLFGLIVDGVEEVTQVTADNLDPAPDFGGHPDADYIIAMARVKGRVKALLDIDKLVASDASEQLEATG